MNEITTMEKLQMKVKCNLRSSIEVWGPVLGNRIILEGGFLAKVYEFVETPEETGFSEIECRISLIAESREN